MSSKQNWDLADRVVIITGASDGIGAALARELAGRGAHLALAARSVEALEEVAASARALGVKAIAVPTDVTDPEQCRALVERTVDELGGIDALVANAGISMWARFDEIEDLSLFERIMRVNYLGAVYCTHHALAHVLAREGLLVAISSLTGKTGVPTRTAYAASKHAMQGFFDSLRVEIRETGAGVLVVSPGFVATAVRERALGGDGKELGASKRDQSSHTMSVEQCVRSIADAMQARKRELVMVKGGQVTLALGKLFPGRMDAATAKAVNDPGR